MKEIRGKASRAYFGRSSYRLRFAFDVDVSRVSARKFESRQSTRVPSVNMQALLRSLPSQAQVLGNAVRVQLPQRAFSTLRPSLVQAAPRVPSFALCQRRFIHDSLFDDKLLNAVEISTEKNIVTKTPEERWAERSKRAMTYHAANPPPGPYHGKLVLLLRRVLID